MHSLNPAYSSPQSTCTRSTFEPKETNEWDTGAESINNLWLKYICHANLSKYIIFVSVFPGKESGPFSLLLRIQGKWLCMNEMPQFWNKTKIWETDVQTIALCYTMLSKICSKVDREKMKGELRRSVSGGVTKENSKTIKSHMIHSHFRYNL